MDTAGIRRKRAIEDESIERYSVIRSLAAIRRADVDFSLECPFAVYRTFYRSGDFPAENWN